MTVFVLDKRHKPLMPCSEKKARLLLTRRRARIHRMYPFTIRLVDRILEESSLQPVRCKIDPGSITTGIAIVREHNKNDQTVLSLLELTHKGSSIKEKLTLRRGYRRRRRNFLRYRAPRFNNRTKPEGWLPPSLMHRVNGTESWIKRLHRLVPIVHLTCESVRFDLQKLENPEIQGIEYSQGTLLGYEIREYLLETWGRKCAYCDKENTPLQIDHIVPKSRGGSNRVSNLTLACADCNQKKGNLSVEEFSPKKAKSITCKKPSFRDASAVNSTRQKLAQTLTDFLPCELASGGQTKYNRVRLQIPKTHALDAACTGEVDQVFNWNIPTQKISCMGRGSYQRTRSDRYGFPRGILPRQKQVHGFQTGDHVKVIVPKGKHQGTHTGRIAVRSSGSFNLQTGETTLQGISWKHCRLIQRNDGYRYERLSKPIFQKPLTKRRHASSPT